MHNDILAHRLVAVRKALDGLRLPAGVPAEINYLVSYYRSLLTEREGDYRSALAQVQKAVVIAERVKLDSRQSIAEEQLALLLRSVGRSREAAELFDRARQYPRSFCEEGDLLNNQAWSMLLAREAGERVGDPTRLLEKALETYGTCKEVTPEMRANILINLALAHLQEDRPAQAKELLTQAHELEPHASIPLMLWQLDLAARIALREGRPEEALHLFNDLKDLAQATSSADGRLRATLGKARSQEALGDRTAALETLREAEALLDEQSLQIPLHEGRETFMATRQAVVSLHVELLLEQDRPAEALAVARHGRSRMLRQLERGDRLANLTPDQRARWESLWTAYHEKRAALEERAKEEWRLPEDQRRQERAARKAEAEAVKGLLDQVFLLLEAPGEQPGQEPPPPRPGELILAYHPLPLPRRWVGFAADGKTVAVHRFDLPPDLSRSSPEELARRLLLPFRASIEKARQIRILPSGPLQGVDFHELPFDGDVLLAGRPVVYGLDLPVSAGPAQAPGRHALLVADPRDDLPGALSEIRTVSKILQSGPRSWITEELKSTEASTEAVRRRFDDADLLHYAGHGVFSGFGGWESGLLLAEETQLTLGDILALERVPAWVVLSGCDTGRSSVETPVESLGLAQAFLLAGSREVVASIRPASDREVPAFFTDLYRMWDRETDLAVAFQRAQLSWRQRNPEADWGAFRLFEP
ncbi:MAG TPA: CHAT domain-containing protein [Thermoanaerobaculia bacterium]|nr:CHAT domain-containing protein [Thermoanaerobaculia bacterium]